MMLGHALNIAGGEWVIIVFAVLVLILGTNRLPDAAKKLGRVVSEYNRAKNDVESQVKGLADQTVEVDGPVQNERQKLETISKSLGISPDSKTDDELREIVSSRLGKKQEKPG